METICVLASVAVFSREPVLQLIGGAAWILLFLGMW